MEICAYLSHPYLKCLSCICINYTRLRNGLKKGGHLFCQAKDKNLCRHYLEFWESVCLCVYTCTYACEHVQKFFIELFWSKNSIRESNVILSCSFFPTHVILIYQSCWEVSYWILFSFLLFNSIRIFGGASFLSF